MHASIDFKDDQRIPYTMEAHKLRCYGGGMQELVDRALERVMVNHRQDLAEVGMRRRVLLFQPGILMRSRSMQHTPTPSRRSIQQQNPSRQTRGLKPRVCQQRVPWSLSLRPLRPSEPANEVFE